MRELCVNMEHKAVHRQVEEALQKSSSPKVALCRLGTGCYGDNARCGAQISAQSVLCYYFC